jgi:uncharacterized RDD family membrane protein YckC
VRRWGRSGKGRTGRGSRSRRRSFKRTPIPRIAPIHRRFLASLIDAVIALLTLAFAFAGWFGVARLTGRKPVPSRRLPLEKLTSSRRARLGLNLFSFVVSVVVTGRRGPGSRIVGVRLVDLDTGARVGVRQAVVREGVRWILKLAIRRATAPFEPRARTRPPIDDLRETIQALTREHADDPGARDHAIMALYKERQVNPRRACLSILVSSVFAAVLEGPLPWSSRKQSVADMIAGTVVVRER